MKALDKFGGWILDKGWLIPIVPLLAIPFVVEAYTGGKTAEVTSKEFVCTATSSVGIEPRCDQYTRIKGPNLAQ
jgi:hypothetical protein